MKTITKRALARNPSVVTNVKPSESVQVRGRVGNLVVSHLKRQRLTAEQIESELDRLADKCPPMDCQAVLNDLRS